MSTAIELKNLSKTFQGAQGPVHALGGVDLTIEENEFVTVVGPSGCGKTTMLRMVSGLETWDDGEILVHGEPVRGPGPERSMVFQTFALLPWATVVSNVAFGLELRGVPRATRDEKARELIELVGLAGFEDARPSQLSGGMQQRVGLARALAVEPQILLMDEPFSALDEQTRRFLQEELLRIWESRRTTVMFVTHSIEEAVMLGDKVILMGARPGRIREIVPVPLSRPRTEQLSDEHGAQTMATISAKLWDSLKAQEMEP